MDKSLSRSKTQRVKSSSQISLLLRSIGVPVPVIGLGRTTRLPGFWLRHPHELLAMLEHAKECFRARIKIARSDLVENHEEAVALILAWKVLEKRFHNHGIKLYK